ncbi:hypothetical protein Gorai_016382 [Gossypium raimondii]|uniref:DUF4283 domain-containing protein n=1 Tax=Gossypium raimondii TaxID=29730 RepID=A0A7J8P8V2_GOSRA|nr:hypothetical protein [Gossypium raimondii]
MMVDSAPVNGVAWKDKLFGGSGSGSLDCVTNLGLEFEDGDILRSTINGIPAIEFLDRLKKNFDKGYGVYCGYQAVRAQYRTTGFLYKKKDIRGDWKLSWESGLPLKWTVEQGDQSSHGGGENSTSLTINESMPVKTGEVSVTMAKPLVRRWWSSANLDLKRHTVVTFKENLEHNSKSNMGKGIVIARENSSSISRGHGVENKKGNGHSGKTLNKTIHGCGGRDVRVRSLFKLFRNIIKNIDWFNLIIAKLGFQNSHRAKVVRFSGGNSSWSPLCMAALIVKKMRHLWDALQGTIPLNGFPWVRIGDFNVILSSSGKKGGRIMGKRCSFFGNLMDFAQLQDLGF